MIIACGEDAQVVGGLDGRGVLRQTVADGGGVFGHGGFLNIVASLGADEKSLVAKHGVDVGGWAFEEVEEGAEVEVGLLVIQVQFATIGLFCGQIVGQDFGSEASGELVFKLDLGIERIGSGP